MRRCLICRHTVPDDRSEPRMQPRYSCPVCGTYRLSEYVAQRLTEFACRGGGENVNLRSDHYLLSAVIRERFEASGRQEVYIPSLEELEAAARPLVERHGDHASNVG
jgi:hypothetical protein